MKWWLVTIFLIVLAGTGCGQQPKELNDMEFPVQKSEEEWRSMLTEEQYRVLRNKGTERPYSGALYYLNDEGIYTCAACQAPLFTSETKFDAHCGWPSFYAPVSENAVVEQLDKSHGMIRTEILCGNCGGHLGHVFNDGPNPTGLRYCINSVSLEFAPKDESQGAGNKVE
jgi:peptide-methionine (R)-S-oxide reductase